MSMDQSIDEDRLRELEEDFGADGLEMIVDAFLEEAIEIIEVLGQSVSDAPDQDRVGHFHFLAGAARNIGAKKFGDLCSTLEHANGPFTESDYASFLAEYEAAKAYFAARYGQSAA